MDPVREYCEQVLDGQIVTGRPVRWACERHLADLAKGEDRGLVWYEDLARTAIEFFHTILRLEDGRPFILAPFEAFIVGSLFGWYRYDGYRRFRTAYVELGKGSGKTPLGAGIGIYGLVADHEPSAEIYSAATSRDQASICFKDAKRMVEASPALQKRVEINMGNLAVLSTNSYFRPVSSEHKALDGKRVHIAIIDELHEHPSAIVVDKMRAGTKSRQNALLFEITNSGFDRNSVCWQHHDLSVKVLQGIVQNDAWFAYVASLDPCAVCQAEGRLDPNPECDQCDDWRDEQTWLKANPGLDVILPRQYLREQVAEAVSMPSKENIVRRLNFCQWCVAFGTLISMADGTRRPAETLHTGDAILAFDEEKQLIVTASVEHVAEQATVPIYRIETARGRIVRVTGNHRFWARWGRPNAPKYGWQRADELRIGSRIASALGVALPPGSLSIKAEDAYLLGVMVGDGTCKELKVTTISSEIIDACTAIMKPHGCEFVTYKKGGPWHYAKHLSISRGAPTWLKLLLTEHGLNTKTAYNKRVPVAIFQTGREVWAAFLSGYLDTDGCVLETKGNRVVQWSSVSRDLLSDCQHLLSLMGIQSSVNTINREKIIYRLEVRDPISLSFLANALSPVHRKKARRLAQFKTRTRVCYLDRRQFDSVKSIQILPPQPTIGIEVEQFHTHITDGLISHNTESQTRWLSMVKWDECNLGPITLESLRGRPCFAGLDLASTIDIAALVLLFPPLSEEDVYVVLPYFFVPEDHPRARSDKEILTYKDWIRQGLMIATEGDVIDYDAIRACIAGPKVLQSFAPGAVQTYTESLKKWNIPPEGLSSMFDIQAIVKDRWNSTGIGTQLQGDGFTVVDFGQGFASMTAPARKLEGIIQSRELNHGGHPVLRWMAANTMVRTNPAGNIKPDKEKSTEKIDGIVALLMPLGVADKTPIEAPPIYETRGAIGVSLRPRQYD